MNCNRNCLATALITLSAFLFLPQSDLKAQTSKNGKVVAVQNVINGQIHYILNLQSPEVPIANVVKEFLSKDGITKCEHIPGTNTLLITTTEDITHEMLIVVAKHVGCQATYQAFRDELQARLPRKEIKQEVQN